MSTIAERHVAAADRSPAAAQRPRRSSHSATKRREPFRTLDRKLETWLGADLRLIYGMAVPVVLVIAAMVPMFLHPTYWLVGAILVFELLCLSVVVTKLLAFLDDEG